MKQLTLLQQQNPNRRSNSFRGSPAILDGAVDGPFKSPATLFWVLLHGLCCLISLVLGFRFSRLVFFLLFSPTNRSPSAITMMLSPTRPPSDYNNNRTVVPGSRVVVGRHGILIRPWPHPNPGEVMKAHSLIERVQKEQRVEYGVEHPRSVIVVTTTYVRTFQALHLTSLMHSLMNCPYHVVWIVVEAGGTTNETSNLIHTSGVRVIHLGFDKKMGLTWGDRYKIEDLMRVQALRLIRDRKLDGVVMFCDDSNMHSLELFDEVQRVEWVGAVSVGILVHSGDVDESLKIEKNGSEEEGSLPIQGPACNFSGNLVGWHTFDSMPYAERRAVYVGDLGTVLPRKMEWAGFVLNSRLLWRDGVDKPEWVVDLDSLGDGDIESPLSLLKNPSVVEPLGSCGRKVLLWWLRVEARADSKFPSGWVIKTPLEITVPAKHTPWPDVPPELPSDLKVTATEQQFVEEQFVDERTEKQPPKTRSRKRSSRKKRRDNRVADAQISSTQLGDK